MTGAFRRASAMPSAIGVIRAAVAVFDSMHDTNAVAPPTLA